MSTGRVKIQVPLQNDPFGYEAEWLWAEPDQSGGFVVDNSPFSIYGLSYQDVVEARLLEGALRFIDIKKKGGHRTIRIRLPRSSNHSAFLKHWRVLEILGCTFEGSQTFGPLYSVDIPPDVDVAAVISEAQKLEDAGVWEYEEADIY